MSAGDDWQAANQRHLAAALAVLAATIEGVPSDEAAAELRAAGEAMPAPPALEALAAGFGLSPFERDIVLLCAGPELDALLPASQAAPTFGLALAVLPDAHWTRARAGRSAAALAARRGRARARRSPRARSASTSVSSTTSRASRTRTSSLQGLARRRSTFRRSCPPRTETLADRIAAALARSLAGDDPARRRATAPPRARSPPRPAPSLGAARRRARRRRRPRGRLRAGGARAPLGARGGPRRRASSSSSCGELEGEPELRVGGRRSWTASTGRSSSPAGRPSRRAAVPSSRLESRRPSAAERAELWRVALGDATAGLNGEVDVLAAQFDIGRRRDPRSRGDGCGRGARAGRDECSGKPAARWSRPGPRRARAADRAGRELGRPRPPGAAAWRSCASSRRTSAGARPCYDDWGFGAQARARPRHQRALRRRERHRQDDGRRRCSPASSTSTSTASTSASVVSKYIGETEKNLRRVFDAAEGGGAILLFDEADALFGKRTEVKDSHDRYANIEVSYLLQRMEAYRGLAILTTNMKEALDAAFLRRLRFVVEFPFPDAGQRAEIWRRIFPERTPTEGLDLGGARAAERRRREHPHDRAQRRLPRRGRGRAGADGAPRARRAHASTRSSRSR